MSSPRLDRARTLAEEVRQALDAADLADVPATLDALEVAHSLDSGIVVVAAPKLKFAGPFGDVQAEYELHVIAGPADDYLRAWERIDVILQALVDADLNLRDAQPAAFDLQYGEPAPCYTVTLNDLD